MQLTTVATGTSRTIQIRADERLDWNIHRALSRAIVLASSPWIEAIEIDLKQTRVIRDSGMSLLSMMCEKSGLSRNRIGLVNCRPEIRERLINSKLAGYLRVA